MKPMILCSQANQIDMVVYLDKLGYRPQKIAGSDYWYLSPLREEKTASFKVNREKNIWYDHGTGMGGRLVDFGILFYQCTVGELLTKLGNEESNIVFFHQQKKCVAGERKETDNVPGKIKIISATQINNNTLKNYLKSRCIPLEIARQYCNEVSFELYGRKHLAIGFKNENGGYELRNDYFKGSSTPKEPRLIKQKDSNDLTVFEGFFNFLSYMADLNSLERKILNLPKIQADALILNSIAFFEKNRGLMESYEKIYLFLDRDKMGVACTEKALQWSAKYIDQSHFYKNYKDLNDCLLKSIKSRQKHQHSKGMGL